MALIKVILGELSGKIADLVFARGPSGPYVRQRVNPVQPETPDQTNNRERMSGLSKQFNDTLSDAQRAGWLNLSRLVTFRNRIGDAITLSAIALRNKVGIRMLAAGDTPLDDAPADLDVESNLTVDLDAVTGGGNTFDVTFTPVLAADDRLVVKGVVNVKPSVNFVEDKMKYVAATAKAAVSPVTITMPAKFGNLTTGQKLIVRVIRYNSTNGAYSPGIVVHSVIA